MRINKYLSEAGVASRRQADRLIEEGRVTINGEPIQPGAKTSERDHVFLDGKEVMLPEKKVVLAYYKPAGLVVTEDRSEPRNIMDAIEYPTRLTYFGRLDKDSEGLLLLSNDGDLGNALMRGRNRHEKEYVVRVSRRMDDDFLARMEQGVYLPELGVKTRPCRAKKIDSVTFSLVLTQGLNRQIRRMCDSLGYRVVFLKRIRIQNILLGDMKPGELRLLDEEEEKELRKGVFKRDE